MKMFMCSKCDTSCNMFLLYACDDICLIRNITLVSILNSHTVILDYFPLHMSVEICSLYMVNNASKIVS